MRKVRSMAALLRAMVLALVMTAAAPLAGSSAAVAEEGRVVTYPAPEGAPLKTDYDVSVQAKGSAVWQRLDTYMAKVNAPLADAMPMGAASLRGTGHGVSEISYALFDFRGAATVRVVKRGGGFADVRVRPASLGIKAVQVNDSTVELVLPRPENVSVEFDGDIRHNLLLFSSEPPLSQKEARRQAKADGRRFVYVPAGFYASAEALGKCSSLLQTSETKVLIPSGTTVYMAGGAYFSGTLAIEDAEHVSIQGRGIARPVDGYEGCHVHRSRHVSIDGLVVNTCPVGGSRYVTLHDVRSISYPGWGDGLNVFASSDVTYDRVFCRNSDDCTTAYATRKGFCGNARNIKMCNSTLWADVAHPIFIGIHGATSGPHPEVRDTVENLVYENIDILCQSEPQVDYQGCLAINAGDDNLVRNVLFDRIRIEALHQGALLHVKVGFNKKWCATPGLGVEDITFRQVSYTGPQPYLSVINGYDEQRRVRNVVFEGLTINGRVITDDMADKPRWYQTADLVPIFIGNHVENVRFGGRSDE